MAELGLGRKVQGPRGPGEPCSGHPDPLSPHRRPALGWQCLSTGRKGALRPFLGREGAWGRPLPRPGRHLGSRGTPLESWLLCPSHGPGPDDASRTLRQDVVPDPPPPPPAPAPSPAPPGPPGDRSFRSQPGSGQWPEMPSSGRGPGGHRIPGRGWRQLHIRPRPPSLGWKGAPRTCCLGVGGHGQLPTGLGWWRTQEMGAGGHCTQGPAPPRLRGVMPTSTLHARVPAPGPAGFMGQSAEGSGMPPDIPECCLYGLLGLTQEAQEPQPLFPLGRPTV